MDDYALHVWFVSRASERGPASKRLQKLFDRKWQREVKGYSDCDDESRLCDRWQAARAGGDIAGPFWAILSHPQVSQVFAERVYRQVHMLSHQWGAGHRDDLGRLSELERERVRLATELQPAAIQSAQRLAEKAQTIDALEERLARSKGAELRLSELAQGGTSIH